VSLQVLHLDLISLSPTTSPEDRQQLIEAAAGLSHLGGVIAAGCVEAEPPSDFDLAFYFALEDFARLEPFGTDPGYSRFLQGEVAPRLKAFAGADVVLDEDFESMEGPASVIAIMAPEETYDWEVREALQSWAMASGADRGVIGLAVGERQAYRGVAFASTDAPALMQEPGLERFKVTIVRGRARAL
jgi:hypothetical protein